MAAVARWEVPTTFSPPSQMRFEDFPEDVQLTILSFLTPSEISSFASTSRRFAALCGQPRIWYAMCDRRWGSRTVIKSWTGANATSGSAPLRLIYKALERWDNLIGFWRRVGSEVTGAPTLLFFEWGPSFITGYRISPSTKIGSYDVRRTPFLWLGLSRKGEPVVFVHNGHRFQSADDLLKLLSCADFSDPELVPVTVAFAGENYFILKENCDLYSNGLVGTGDFSASPPDRLMSEIYQYFANRTSPGADRATRKQRKKVRERLGRRKSITEHYMKITDSHPTPSRPFQGLWKGICENMILGFYLIIYNDNGGIVCRRVGDSPESFSGFSIFWTSETKFLEFPFSREEEDLYNTREHIQPIDLDCSTQERQVVSRILSITSSSDLVLPDVHRSSLSHNESKEGRIWEYKNGKFGFGFLRSGFIIDLKRIALNGYLLDAVEYSSDASYS